MSEHYDFHYQPTGSGAISGQQVLQQTEDAINELGDYVNDNVGGAMDVAQQALETAQTAETNAQTALDTANSFSSAIQSAQQDASTALSTAQTAQTTASNANNTAIQASQDASSAVTTANNASGQVSTLSGTVTALGQRVTTAEGNIGQNTSDITALTTRIGTAEGNITTLQNDVSIAQGNASSAMATAGTVKQQSYVLRYSSTAITDNSTIAYSTLDNTDNIKASDKVIDVDGKIFSVVSVDTANQTVTVGTAIVDLALDSNVVHTSGNETISGGKTFSSNINVYNSDSTTDTANIILKNSKAEVGTEFAEQSINFVDKNNNPLAKINCYGDSGSNTRLYITASDSNNNSGGIFIRKSLTGTTVLPTTSSAVWLGNSDLPFFNVQTKRVNGLTPSSLGMPVAPSTTSYVDISGYITVLDSSSANTYTPPSNGYITFSVTGNLVQIFHDYGLQGKWTVQAGNANHGFIPVLGGVEVKIYITASTVDKFWFIPCQGNV